MGAKPAYTPLPREEDWVLTAKRHVPLSWVDGSGCWRRDVLGFLTTPFLRTTFEPEMEGQNPTEIGL